MSARGRDHAGMEPVAVRVARPADIEPARQALRAAYMQYETAFHKENWEPYLENILDIEGRSESSTLMVAESGGEIAGCVSYYPPGAETYYPAEEYTEHWPTEWASFRLLAVHPAARGGG